MQDTNDNRRCCTVCGAVLTGRRSKYCAVCAAEVVRERKKPQPGQRLTAGQARMALLRKKIGSGYGGMMGLSLSETAAMATEYGMTYGRFVGYIHATGRLPEKRRREL